VFADVEDHHTIAREEIFGPVMSILKFSDIEEVADRANDTEYGLAAAVYSNNFPRARGLAQKLRAGILCGSTATTPSTLPFPSVASRRLVLAGTRKYDMHVADACIVFLFSYFSSA
jgi:acyl-CoA reductase-like NAD-dependent aldehyde dehydrogenase